ncbi:polysaccharide deacetylase family sporulation protein PdaB [Gracilibacillus orientalis]|uniref:Polysaccharide deacetylase family sporulation protein PdaB n=1 Tax=Gracilibacillus orientalis TaxID=334253 RepID=A0A1I4QQK4_9BACI|nr:polysaccharide deacetylase family protein [Gracilibacillus orientalis]SFM42309.1 polysaccharide deacetylase family sporulation protein PdaB [Gracilibacillus orientalis]
MRRLYIVDIKKQKKAFIIIPIAFFVALFLFLEFNYTSTVFSDQDNPRALNAGNTEHSSVALTFNISHGDEQVHPILERLKNEGVQATFFVSGEWAERHPDILEQIAEDKHEIGMLGYQYQSYVEQELDEVRSDLNKAKDIFSKLGYEDIYLLRAPNGHLNEEVINLAENQGLKVIHWSINPNDWQNPGTEKITNHILKNIRNGSIILLHASDSVKQTEKALEAVIPEIKGDKKFLTISELTTQAETNQEELQSKNKGGDKK